MKTDKNKGIALSPDELLKMALAPKPRKFTVILNGKNPIYPKQSRLYKPKKPDSYKELCGISVSGYDILTVGWKNLGEHWFTIRIIDKNTPNAPMFYREVGKYEENPTRINLSKDSQTELVVELGENVASETDVILDIALTYRSQK